MYGVLNLHPIVDSLLVMGLRGQQAYGIGWERMHGKHMHGY